MMITTVSGDRLPLTSFWGIRLKDRGDGTVEAQFTPAGPIHQFWDEWCAGAMMVEMNISREEANRISHAAPHLLDLSRPVGLIDRRPVDEIRPPRKSSRRPREAKQTAFGPGRNTSHE